jgi:hypothetical protein
MWRHVSSAFAAVTALSAAIIASLPASLQAAQVESVWNGGAGNWGQGSNWDGAISPNNGVNGNTYLVYIDRGNAATSSVTLDISPTIDGLELDSADTLNIINSRALTILSVGGFLNNGQLTFNSSSDPTTLHFSGEQTITGNGQVNFVSGGDNRITTNNTVLTNGAGHTIRGGGRLLNNSGGLINLGTILLDQPGGMTVDPNGLGFVNSGTMRASGTGIFAFSAGTFTNNTTIEILTGSTLTLSGGVSIIGGTLTTAGTGQIINTSGTNTFDGVTLNGTLNQNNATAITVLNGLTNNGSFNINPASDTTTLHFQWRPNDWWQRPDCVLRGWDQ